jgi:NADH-quinone oxidoreductase E subunit
VSATASPFTPEQQQAFDAEVAKIVPRYPPDRRSAALIPVLHAAQRIHGWLKPETLAFVAGVVGVPLTRVQEVVTFYSMFHLKPVGRHHFQVCVNLSCWLGGSDEICATLKERIGPEQSTPTADGQFSWCEVECLAACGMAPAVQINDQYFESLTTAQLERELDARARK